MRKNRISLLLIFLIITISVNFIAGCSTNNTGKTNSQNVVSRNSLVKIRLANLAVGIGSMPQQLAVEKGIFAKRGIDLQVVNFVKGGAEATAGVASGQVDMGSYGTPILTGISKGLPIKIIASPPNKRIDFVLVAVNDIKTVQDLKGKTVATGALGGGNHQSFLKILKGNDVQESDVNVVATGGTDAYMILTSGKVAAVETNLDVAIRAESEGTGHLLARSQDYYQHYQHSYVFATNQLIKSNPEAVREFLAASREGYEYARDHQEELIDYTVKQLGLNEAWVREYWKQTIPKWDLSFKIDVQGTEGAVKVLQDLNEIDPNVKFEKDKWIDLRFTGAWKDPNDGRNK